MELKYMSRHHASLIVHSRMGSRNPLEYAGRFIDPDRDKRSRRGVEANSVLVIGATSQVGYHLLPLLAEAGWQVKAVSRAASPVDSRGATWHRVDLANSATLHDIVKSRASAISLAPIRLLPERINSLANAGVTRIIAFSSTSRFTKAASADPNERALAETFARSEDAFAKECSRTGIAWTIFRPTLVYSPGRDRNVSEIARFIRRFGFFPIVGDSRGKRQPVHAADLAAGCVAALVEPKTFSRAYDVSGGETVTYREMVERVFHALGRAPRIVHVPAGLLKVAINIARNFPRFKALSPELVTRMNTDMCFDPTEASRDFGFHPRSFDLRTQGALGSIASYSDFVRE